MTRAVVSGARLAEDLTAVILTYDEEANLPRTLDSLGWVRKILLVDSGSNDETLAIAARYPQVRVVHRAFDSFAGQCNAALEMVDTAWVLSLDADYELSPELSDEIQSLREDGRDGWRARFVYRIYGHSLRGSLYPPRCVLYRRSLARYEDQGHGHRVDVSGDIGELRGVIYHDDRKPLGRWLTSQSRYAQVEAEHLLSADRSELSWVDRIRLIGWPAPFLVFLHVLFVRGCVFDGWAGIYYAMQRMFAEAAICVALLDRRLKGLLHKC